MRRRELEPILEPILELILLHFMILTMKVRF